ncbi:MAG TPA: phenylacetic acid degradation operon negative regulatory protein PaaX, partial [bacterium]|nr:phenylacetic acid degradation operon negative regulatory protein PaaX [bacterium]
MQARSMLFTLYGDYVRHYGGTVWVGSLIALMTELGFTPSAVRAAVSRMTRQGWLVSIRS